MKEIFTGNTFNTFLFSAEMDLSTEKKSAIHKWRIFICFPRALRVNKINTSFIEFIRYLSLTENVINSILLNTKIVQK